MWSDENHQGLRGTVWVTAGERFNTVSRGTSVNQLQLLKKAGKSISTPVMGLDGWLVTDLTRWPAASLLWLA